MGKRRLRKTLIQQDQRQSRITNGYLKVRERERRQRRLMEKLQGGKLPYAPAVMSWLSQELNKPSRQITQEDVDKYVAAHAVTR